jgi:integrase
MRKTQTQILTPTADRVSGSSGGTTLLLGPSNAPPALTAEDYIAAATARSTTTEYAKDVRLFLKSGGTVPANVAQVSQYIVDVAPTIAPATLARRLVSLHRHHIDEGLASPVLDPHICTLMQGVRRTFGVQRRQVKAMEVAELLETIAIALKQRPMRAARDAALLLFGWAGAMRRSEIVALRAEDIKDMDGGVTVLIRRSKTDQEGKGFTKFIPFTHGERCPVQAVKHWQDLTGIQSGFLFRAVDKHENVADRPLSAHAVALIIKTLISETGRDPSDYSGHSLRSGFLTAGAVAGLPTYQLMAVSGHRSEQMLLRYIRPVKRRVPSLL